MSETMIPTYKPWNRFGNRRVYVAHGEAQLGWFDPDTLEVTAESEDHRDILTAAAHAWAPPPAKDGAKAPAAPEEPAAAKPARPMRPDRDLAVSVAGGHAQSKADELLAAKSWWERTTDKYLMRKTESEAWRRGALGERKVGAILNALGPEWYVLHGVPAGPRGADIDHLLIGPPGVFTVNTKNHARVPVRVTHSSIYTGTGKGYRTDYLAKALKEAAFAGDKLGVDVFPVICIIPDIDGRYTEKGKPKSVTVVRSDKLTEWAASWMPMIEPAEVERLYSLARRSSTWEA